MIKKYILIFCLLMFVSSPVYSNTQTNTLKTVEATISTSQTVPQAPIAVDYTFCLKDYQMPANELFHRTLAAISASNYKIVEIQSKSSRILFLISGREFWAGVTKQNSGASTLRILPSDNSFYFKKELIDKIFNEIDTYKNIKINQVGK